MKIGRIYFFEAAHHLPFVAPEHKCRRIHGHNYKVEVTLEGEVDHWGFVEDFWNIDKVMEPLLRDVDHRLLNDVSNTLKDSVILDNPTAENIATWFRDYLVRHFEQSVTVRVWETDRCWAEAS